MRSHQIGRQCAAHHGLHATHNFEVVNNIVQLGIIPIYRKNVSLEI